MSPGRSAWSGLLVVLGLAAACGGTISLGSDDLDAAATSGTPDGSRSGSSGGATSSGSSGSSPSSSGGTGSSSSGPGSSSGGEAGASTDAIATSADAGPDACSSGACGTAPPSCQTSGPGLTTCGPGGSGAESCCASLDIAGGTFYRTYSNDGGGPTGEADPGTVSDFRLDKYLVTVGRFRQFFNAWHGGSGLDGGAGYEPPAGAGKHSHLNAGLGLANSASSPTYEPGWATSDDAKITPTIDQVSCPAGGNTWTDTPGDQENLPINCVSWYSAYAFCIWDAAFLPSEAEWEYVAAGGAQQREYPWGSTDPGTSNQYAIDSPYYGHPTLIAPVGTAAAGAGRWGQLDMAGDLFEWTLDTYGSFVDPCVDCAYLSGPGWIVKGGDFNHGAPALVPPYRLEGPGPAQASIGVAGGSDGVGFRCARAPVNRAPSCQAGGNGLTNCGAASEDCCASPEVPGGTFYRTYTATGNGPPTGLADPATVSGFRLDKYLVSVGRFRQFVAAWNGGAGYLPPAGSGKHTHLNGGLGLVNVDVLNGRDAAGVTYETGWDPAYDAYVAPTDANLVTIPPNSADTSCNRGTWTSSPGDNENLPINCVNWYEAYAFCIWDGACLPSDAEWEYAAAGGSQQREFPWGSTDPGIANEYAIFNCNYGPFDCAADGGPGSLVANIAPVGTPPLGAGLWGQTDLSGEVYEWTLDWNPVDAYAPDPCTDCAELTPGPGDGGPAVGPFKRARGSFFLGNPSMGTTAEEVGAYSGPVPAVRVYTTGLRCARTP